MAWDFDEDEQAEEERQDEAVLRKGVAWPFCPICMLGHSPSIHTTNHTQEAYARTQGT